MKKIRNGFWVFYVVIVSLILLALPIPVHGEEFEDILDITRQAGYDVLDINKPKAAIVIDGSNGQILWANQPDEIRDPASITKMMTVYLVLEAIKQGQLSMETEIVASETDQAIGQIFEISNNDIVAGVAYPVRDLLYMVTVPSSNVATVMLANQISEQNAGAFIDRMNAKAQELGMTNTKFFNCSGASAQSFMGYYTPEGYDQSTGNQTTARDLAIMTYHLINNYPEVLEFTSQPVVKTMEGTPYEETFETYNYSIPGAQYGVEGVDGLKTGSSPAAGFNYIATAKRGETRLIEVIMGVGDWSDQDGEYYRHPFGNALLEKMFAEYEYQKLVPAGLHEVDGQKVTLDQDLYGVAKKGSTPNLRVADNQMIVDNGLQIVSDKLQTLAITYQPLAEDKGEPTASDSKESVAKPASKSKLTDLLTIENAISVALVVLGGILLLIAQSMRSTSKDGSYSRRRRKNSRFKLIGRLLGAASILGGIIWFIFNNLLH
ncbi:DUF1958 domain-containing protein [Candidatus Enterococcus clewellii]|uniref:D-alanyl-D-alanine carboxypeptidase n=1 Tax=Candidatus Enterococcus clewellii TaxID=1834193 RepID=A0A242KCU3_9ENTE|nr:DUF1958 domain-containing protein [Enterococcus sp. 9E7_DIV0242]OTP18889.1 hypothetical protein A5888_000703 [Enterococcus sp. 9E7_DIV0242]